MSIPRLWMHPGTASIRFSRPDPNRSTFAVGPIRQFQLYVLVTNLTGHLTSTAKTQGMDVSLFLEPVNHRQFADNL